MKLLTYEITVYGSTGYIVHRETRKVESYHAADIIGRQSVLWCGGVRYEIKAVK